MLFEIIEARTSVAQVAIIAEMGEEEIEVTTKWDGCADLYFGSATAHLCDWPAWLVTLGLIREMALAYFDGEFGVAPLRADEVAKKIADIQGIIKAKFSEMETA